MTAPNDSVIALSRALDQAGDVLTAVHEDQLDRPTPCEDWDVSHLIGHLVAMPRRFVTMARGERYDPGGQPGPAGTGWAAEFRSAADDLIHAWHQAGEDADPGAVDLQTAEFAVHTWDLATATGQPTDQLDPLVAERGLALLSAGLTEENRGTAFAPAQQPPEDAGAYERLAAYAGRRVA